MKGKMLRRFTSLTLIVTLLLSMFAVSAVTANAAANDVLNLKVADVTKKYSDIGSMLSLINSKRSQSGLSALTMDQPLMDEAIIRAVELPMMYGTADLLDVSYTNRWQIKESFEDNTYLEIVLNSTDSVGSIVNMLFSNADYSAQMMDTDVTEIGIGIVTMHGDNTKFICIRMTNEKSKAGRSPTAVADSTYSQTEKSETVTVQGYINNLNFVSDYDNNDYKIALGETEQLYLKAKEKTGSKNTYALIIPASATTSDWNVFNTDIGGIITAASIGSASITIRIAGENYTSYNKTVTIFSVASISGDFVIDPIPDQPFIDDYVYPDVVVRNSDGVALVQGTDYQVDFFDNIDVGTATVYVAGIGDYDGKTAETTFEIREMSDPLVIRVSSSKYEMLAGETADISVSVSSGSNPKEYIFYSVVNQISQEIDRNDQGTTAFCPREAGEYQIKVIAINDDYTTTQSVNITVYKALTVSIEASANSLQNNKVLFNDRVTFKATAKDGSAPYTYTYKLNNNVVDVTSNDTYSYTPNASGNVTLTVSVTDSQNNTAQSEYSFEVVPFPTCSMTISPEEPEHGDTVTVTVSSTGGFDPVSFTGAWSVDNGEAKSLTFSNNQAQFVASEYGNYTVTAECTDAMQNTSAAVSKTFFIGEPLTAKLTVSKDKIIVGKSVTLTATASGGAAPYTYAFKSNNSTIYSGSDNSCIFTVQEVGQLTAEVVVTDANGLVTEAQVTLQSAETLNAAVPVRELRIYENQDAQVQFEITGGFRPYTTQVSYTSGNLPYLINADDLGNYTVNFAEKGSYPVTITVTDSEGNTASASTTYIVCENVINNSVISNTKVTRGNTLTVTGRSQGGIGDITYTYSYKKIDSGAWTSCGTGTTKEFSFATATSYKIRVVASDANNNSDTKIFTILVKEPKALVNNATIDSDIVYMDEGISINSEVSGGVAPYKFAYYYKKASSTTWQKFGKETEDGGKFIPNMTGDYQLKSVVTDVNNTKAEKVFNVTVKKASTFRNTSTTEAGTVNRTSFIKILGSAKGGSGKYTYAFYYKKSYKIHWKTINPTVDDPSVAYVAPYVTTDYDIKVVATDSNGETEEKIIQVGVERFITDFTNVSEISANEIEWGQSVTINAKAACADTAYNTEFYYKKADSPVWQKIDADPKAESVEFKPIFRTTYLLKVVMTDANQKVSTVNFTLEVT